MQFNPMDEPLASRREFLGRCKSALQVAAVGSLLAPFASSCGQAVIATRRVGERRVEANVALLVRDGMSAVLDAKGPDGKGVLIVRASESDYLAMSMRCTHKGCEVSPPADQVIVCPCHDSRFDLTGAVTKPPATEPLKRYTTSYDSSARSITIELV